MMNEVGAPKRLTADGIVKSGTGKMMGFFVASGTPTILLYDNTAASGTVVLNTMQTTAATWYDLPITFVNGLYADVTGACDITFCVS